MRIAVIEDDRKLARYLEIELVHQGHEVAMSFDGDDGLNLVQTGLHDLIILDVMLPGMSGIDLLRTLRRYSKVPVILLTARDAIEDKVEGLDRGADDYLTKPFSIDELNARIRSIERRQHGHVEEVLQVGDLQLDSAERTVWRNGQEIHLTKREFDLLEYLLSHVSLPQTRDAILAHVWGYGFFGTTNLVDVYVRQLREKIDDEGCESVIQTVRGVGYVIKRPRAPAGA